jgi:hypothetical protein
MPLLSRCIPALLLAGLATSAAAHDKDNWWSRTDDVGRNPVSKTTHEQFDFTATGDVEVEDLGGSVEVRTGSGNKVEFDYERHAASQQDFDCETLRYRNDKDELRIWTEHKRGRDCQVIRANDKLTLTVPPGASVYLRSIGDSATVRGVKGLVRLESIGDSATISGAEQVDAESIGDTLRLEVTRLGSEGIRLESIGDSVDLTLPEKVDARLRIESVADGVKAPGLRLHEDDDQWEAVLGKGGPLIKIESVGDSVVIHGPRIDEDREL